MPHEVHQVADLLTVLLIMFLAAKAAAELFERLGHPAVIGEILAGILIGPQVLNWVSPNELTAALAELGAVFLLFAVGLETIPHALIQASRIALPVAVGGVVLPFAFGYGTMALLGYSQPQDLFMGAALVATSVGITARVLSSMGMLQTRSARLILAAAVIDDILGLLVLAVVSSMAKGSADWTQIGVTAVMAVGFTVFMATVGAHVVKHAAPGLHRLRIGESFFVTGVASCLLLAVVSERIGIAAIVGAFLAGMAFAEPSRDTGMHERTNALTEFLVPFFLVNIGLQLQLDTLRDPATIGLCALLTALAVIGKVVGCGGVMWRQGRRVVGQVGMGMVPRGEVGIIVAQVGLSSGILTQRLFAVAVFIAVATTLIAPPFIKRYFRGEEPEPALESPVAAADVESGEI